MIKKHLKQMLLTSAVILLPIVAGLILWDQLPDTMNIHWNAAGAADGTGSKALAVFFPALLILIFHWLCAALTSKSMKDQTATTIALGLWICPMLSLMVHSIMYSTALGMDFNLHLLLFTPLGILFAVIGNYMPKVRRNAHMGIKTIWALADDENWYATHRFGGKVWTAGGLLVIAVGCLPWKWAAIANFVLIFAFAFAPAVYSWNFYRKQKAAGKQIDFKRNPLDKLAWIIPAVLVPFFVFIMFTGSITFELSHESLTVDSTFYAPLTVAYEEMDSVELREGNAPGVRNWGFASGRLLLGSFSNDELGPYTRYTYTGSGSYIVITAGKNTLVIADKNPEYTRILYENLCEKIG